MAFQNSRIEKAPSIQIPKDIETIDNSGHMQRSFKGAPPRDRRQSGRITENSTGPLPIWLSNRKRVPASWYNFLSAICQGFFPGTREILG